MIDNKKKSISFKCIRLFYFVSLISLIVVAVLLNNISLLNDSIFNILSNLFIILQLVFIISVLFNFCYGIYKIYKYVERPDRIKKWILNIGFLILNFLVLFFVSISFVVFE